MLTVNRRVIDFLLVKICRFADSQIYVNRPTLTTNYPQRVKNPPDFRTFSPKNPKNPSNRPNFRSPNPDWRCISLASSNSVVQLNNTPQNNRLFELPQRCCAPFAMADENISLQSMALQKRSSQTALMPPPPPPKRLKRPPKTLSEEDYTSAITTIIERDFYPNLSEMRLQTKYLDAVEEGNPIRIATAARRLTNQIGRTTTGEDDEETEEERKERVLKEDVSGMRLDMFQAKYTSEDNESFNALLDEQNEKQRQKYAWKYNGNKLLSNQEFLIEQKRVLLLQDGSTTQQVTVPGERDLLQHDGEDGWSKEIQTWKWTPMNVLMNPHPGIEDQPDPSQGQKQIRHKNTSIPSSNIPTGRTPAPSPTPSTVQDALEGRIRSDTPKVNGYSFVSTPTPSELGAPKMTWGELSATPLTISTSSSVEKPSPFRLAEPTEREKLARKLAEKAQKDITARQRAYTPHLRATTTLGTPRAAAGSTPLAAGGKTPLGKTPLAGGADIPKFGSSPDIRRNMLTPAAQRLWASTAQGRRSSRLVERGERESAAQVSANVVGRTPLMRTPMLKDGATPAHR